MYSSILLCIFIFGLAICFIYCAIYGFSIDFDPVKSKPFTFHGAIQEGIRKGVGEYFEKNPHLLAKLIEVKQKRENENNS